MYRKILAAVNEHLNSEVAARYALRLARACGAKLYLCFVAEEGVSKSDLRKAEDTVNRLFLLAEQAGMEAEEISKTGETVREIHQIVRKEDIDIAFMATRREDLERRFFIGTVARKLAMRLPCSVALVRVAHLGRIHPGRILVPLRTRMGHVGERAYFTSRMAEAFGSKVFAYHAAKPVTRFFHGEIHLTPVEWERRMPREIEEFMDKIRRSGISMEARLSPESVGRGIALEAVTKKHDLIIMGASERGFFRSLLWGRPVEHVLRETPCDLIVLKPAHED